MLGWEKYWEKIKHLTKNIFQLLNATEASAVIFWTFVHSNNIYFIVYTKKKP